MSDLLIATLEFIFLQNFVGSFFAFILEPVQWSVEIVGKVCAGTSWMLHWAGPAGGGSKNSPGQDSHWTGEAKVKI